MMKTKRKLKKMTWRKVSFLPASAWDSSASRLLITCPYHLTLLSSSSLQCLPPHTFWSLHSAMSLTSSPSSLLIMCPYHLNLTFLIFFAMSILPRIFWFLHSVMSLTSSPSSLHITCPYHLNLAFLIFSAISTTSHLLLISSFHNVSDQLSFISYCVSIPSQPCFPHLLCKVYQPTSSDLFIPQCLWSALLHLFLLCVHTISTLLSSSSLQGLPTHIFWSLHSTISLTNSPSSLHIMCPYHLNLAFFISSAMSTNPYLLIFSFHNVSDQLSFISSYYVSISLILSSLFV